MFQIITFWSGFKKYNRCEAHWAIPYIVSDMALNQAFPLVHFFQCSFERIFFFHSGESRAMKGGFFFSFSKFWKGVFVKKKKSKKIKAVLRETEFKTEFPELPKPFFKIWKMKKNYFFHSPTFAKMKKNS